MGNTPLSSSREERQRSFKLFRVYFDDKAMMDGSIIDDTFNESQWIDRIFPSTY